MAQGPYDHPSYLTRQMLNIGRTVAGSAGTSPLIWFAFPNAVRARTLTAVVGTAGTATTATLTLQNVSGTTTTSIGVLTLSTATVNQVVTSSDLNTTLAAGSLNYLLNGADTVAVANVFLQYHIDPTTGTWTGY